MRSPQIIALALLTTLATVAPASAGRSSRLPAAAAQVKYRTYANARFSYSITYPASLLIAQGEPENGDGQTFLAKDGAAEMRVWGQLNFDNRSLRDDFQNTIRKARGQVTYKVSRADWFVVSWISQGRIHYQKTMLHDGVFKTFLIEYDQGQRSTYDPITSRIVKSFAG
jgi:hypothetical protein